MNRTIKYRFGWALFDDSPEIHNSHTICKMPHDIEVVCNYENRKSDLVLKLIQEIQNFTLYRDVYPAVGSSAMISRGFNASALATPMRLA